jgi:predicted ribonuclease YlaK
MEDVSMVSKKDNMLFGFRETMTDEQHELLDLILAPTEEVQIIIVEALAGTGKTQMATIGAKLRGKKMRYIFSPVQEGSQGYLPGDIIEKSEPYTAPIKQALEKIFEKPDAIFDPRLNEFMNKKAWVYAHPHTFERGTNYEDETIVIDEAQNFTKHDLRKIITRCHDNCKIIIIGNSKQCDLQDKSTSGFAPYVQHAIGHDWIKKVHLTHNFRGRVAQWADEI